ncbi:two-component system alkaline phosphatase synthesis response regulator PhoP [Anseongella ginsenosidimutans]|uniref:Two-component system alkaline phosphatase synthesis response regulator PhoP n=1 Tax=Anseongella ginsenosidimutans TaxID=496056 RepID=A0A4R3KRH0_9SPHI|nr:response regulator transcription factor [Anseongella ginsenosidimutans]QEC53840.1 response regulator transcription factor [Anseongella ginsenosidimutans]TCS86213.1 two-component system alkaline phosphatase synthesis response regulator PhoP [Anseongella ginsenosidimutans]
MTQRILLAEDEEHLLEAIKLNLELEGYHVTSVTDGKKALKVFHEERFNLVILDVMLPEMDGFRVCEAIRLENSTVPVLFLTAKNTSEDRITGLKKGADDYLTKPFNLEELILRVGILVRRGLQPEGGRSSETYRIGEKEINFSSYEIRDGQGNKTALTRKEAMLLKLLTERRGQVVSRAEILETVWSYDVYPTTRTIDNFILSFRKYFEKDPKNPEHFHSIRGVGYKYTD